MEKLLAGTKAILIYFAVAASSALGARLLIRIPDELFRKILHCILLGSLPVFLFRFETWWMAALEAVGFALMVYPLLAFLDRFPFFEKLTTERKHGELQHSLLLVFGMFAVVMTVCWGWLGDRYLAMASIFAWGLGDAAAALIGKPFGKHKIRWRFTDGKKSYEGSAAMLLTSFVTLLVILNLRGGFSLPVTLLISLVVAFISTLAELYSRNGNDTIICPLCAMAALLPLIAVCGGLL
jgi:dolichol kinase